MNGVRYTGILYTAVYCSFSKWNTSITVYCSFGIQIKRSSGYMLYRYTGVPLYWNCGIMVFRNTEKKVYRYSKTTVHRNPGSTVYVFGILNVGIWHLFIPFIPVIKNTALFYCIYHP